MTGHRPTSRFNRPGLAVLAPAAERGRYTAAAVTREELEGRRPDRLPEDDGWRLARTRGSHRQYKHANKPGTVTVAGEPSLDVPPGTLNAMLKQAEEGEIVMAMKRYMVVVERGDTSWGAHAPDLPGCIAVGETREEVLRLIREAIGAA